MESQRRAVRSPTFPSRYEISRTQQVPHALPPQPRCKVRLTMACLCATAEKFRHLATCSADTTVKIWSISHNYEFKHEKTLTGHQRWVWDCAFSADSAYLVTGARLMIDPRSLIHKVFAFAASSDHTARLWEMASGETVRQYNGHHKGQL